MAAAATSPPAPVASKGVRVCAATQALNCITLVLDNTDLSAPSLDVASLHIPMLLLLYSTDNVNKYPKLMLKHLLMHKQLQTHRLLFTSTTEAEVKSILEVMKQLMQHLVQLDKAAPGSIPHLQDARALVAVLVEAWASVTFPLHREESILIVDTVLLLHNMATLVMAQGLDDPLGTPERVAVGLATTRDMLAEVWCNGTLHAACLWRQWGFAEPLDDRLDVAVVLFMTQLRTENLVALVLDWASSSVLQHLGGGAAGPSRLQALQGMFDDSHVLTALVPMTSLETLTALVHHGRELASTFLERLRDNSQTASVKHLFSFHAAAVRVLQTAMESWKTVMVGSSSWRLVPMVIAAMTIRAISQQMVVHNW
jgi:hypothetical protein